MYKQEMVGAWDRSHKLREIKGKLEKELGIAINDDKIRFIMGMQKTGNNGVAGAQETDVKKRYQPTTQALMESNNSVRASQAMESVTSSMDQSPL